MEPIVLYAQGATANPTKVAILLEELGLPYTVKVTPWEEIKQEPYISLNPNGRLPAIEDPNNGIKLFESGSIIEYLIDQYDKDDKFHYTTSPEKYLTQSWLHFQMSGQGPYFGQKSWFDLFHPEKLPSASERYANEIKRVTGVVDAHLKKQGTPYLVGNKLTYADLSFVPWFNMVGMLMPDWDPAAEFPTYGQWIAELKDRESFKTVKAHPDMQFKQPAE